MGKLLLIIITLLSLSLKAYANDLKRIQDFLTKKHVEYLQVYKELNDSKLNFYEGINIWYPQVILPSNKSVETKLNARLKYLMTEQVLDPAFQKKVKEELERQVNFLSKAKADREAEESEDDEEYYYYYKERTIEPALKDVTFEFLNYSAPIITMRVRYEYETKGDSYIDYDNLYYDEVYYLNVATGKEYRPADVFRKEKMQELSRLIQERVNEQPMKEENSYSDNDEDEDRDRYRHRPSQKPSTFKGFQPEKEGYASVQLLSVYFIIPSYSQGTEAMNGTGTQVRFSLQDIKPFLSPSGPYGHLIKRTSLSHVGQVKNLNVPDYFREGMFIGWLDMRPHIFAEDLFNGHYHLQAPAKNVKEARFYTREVTSRNDTTKRKKVYRSLQYNDKGLLTKVEMFEYRSTPEIIYAFTYNVQGKVAKVVETNTRKKKEQSTVFAYDANGNLTSMKLLNNDSKLTRATYITYTDSFFLVETIDALSEGSTNNFRVDLDKLGRPYAWLSLNSGESGMFYCRYDDKNHIIASYSKKESPLSGQFITYINDRLEAYEHDGGRYLTRYTYDERGNMISEDQYDGLYWQAGSQFQYNERNLPVQLKKLVNRNYFEKGDSNRWYIEYDFR